LGARFAQQIGDLLRLFLGLHRIDPSTGC